MQQSLESAEMSNRGWATTADLEALIVTAIAKGCADEWILSSEGRTRKYLEEVGATSAHNTVSGINPVEVRKLLEGAKLEDGILSIREGNRFPERCFSDAPYVKGDNIVLARECTQHFLELFRLICEGKLKDDYSGLNVYSKMYVRGLPGDGKSRASQFFLQQLLCDGYTVVYQQAQYNAVWVFRADGQTRIFSGTPNRANCPELYFPREHGVRPTVYIFDAYDLPIARRIVQPVGCSAALVMFSSLCMSLAMKQAARDIRWVLEVIFPTPTLQEVLEAGLHIGNRTQEELESLFEQFGGHLRLLFGSSSNAKARRSIAIRGLKPGELFDLCKELQRGPGETRLSALFAIHAKLSRLRTYRLVYGSMDCEEDSGDQERTVRLSALRAVYFPDNCVVDFASESILDELFAAMMKDAESATVLNSYIFCSSAVREGEKLHTNTSKLAGRWFESLAQKCITQSESGGEHVQRIMAPARSTEAAELAVEPVADNLPSSDIHSPKKRRYDRETSSSNA